MEEKRINVLFVIFFTLLIVFVSIIYTLNLPINTKTNPVTGNTIFAGSFFNLRFLTNYFRINQVRKLQLYIHEDTCKSCKDGDCIVSCTLDNYDSLSNLRDYLKNWNVKKEDGTFTTGYDIILELLNDGYNGYINNDFKENFFEPRLSNYKLRQPEKEYIILIVHSIWLDNKNVLPWSLKDYSRKDIQIMFWVNNLYKNQPNQPPTSLNKSQYWMEVYYTPLAEEESSYKLFLLARKFIQKNQSSTINEIIKWQKKNFFHAYYAYTWDNYGDGRNESYKIQIADGSVYPPSSLERIFDERITGCHENAMIFTGLLRALNIPAVSIYVQGHGVTYLPTINRYVHGDHIADFVTIPSNDLLLTLNNMSQIATNSSAYDKIMYNKYPFPRHYFTNIELHRNNTNLFLETNSVCTNIPDYDWNTMRNEVSEYNLQYDQKHCKIFSDSIPIESLKDLSTYP